MKLRYKITIIVTAISTVVFTAAIFYYGDFLFLDRLRETKSKLEFSSADLVSHIEDKLLNKLDIAKTLQSADIVKKTLLQSNKEFEKLSKAVRQKKILGLNARWMNTKDAKDSFIKQYTNNKLALYLKRQQVLLPGIYAEIFITNKYGVLVAATGRLTTLAHAKKYWWKESYAKGKGNYFFDDRGYDNSVRGYVLGIVVPIKQDGKIIGILKTNINVQSLLLKTIIEFNTQNIGVARVVRTKGLVVMEENASVLSTKIAPLLAQKLKARKKGLIDLKINDRMKMISYAPIKFSIDKKNIIFGGKVQSIDHILGNDDEIWNLIVSQNMQVVWDGVLDDIQGIVIISFIFIIFLALLIFFIIKEISSPIKRLSIVANRVGQGERGILIEPETDDEVGELAISFRDMLKDLKRTTASRDELEIEIKKRILMQEEIEKKDQLLLAQSRNAAMGEMIGMIAHQWRQPISIIAMAVNNVAIDIELDDLNEDDILECSKEILNQTNFLSQTIDDFRDFFKPDKEKESIQVGKIFDEIKGIIGKSFENNDIKLTFDGDLEIEFSTYTRELLQVFINILNNAKDALQDGQIQDKEVKVTFSKQKNSIVFKICDNAGGVKEEIKDKIFEPYFSTKEEKNGTGLGLYMSKIIVEKHLLGKIWVQNIGEGACFMIELPIELGGNN